MAVMLTVLACGLAIDGIYYYNNLDQSVWQFFWYFHVHKEFQIKPIVHYAALSVFVVALIANLLVLVVLSLALMLIRQVIARHLLKQNNLLIVAHIVVSLAGYTSLDAVCLNVVKMTNSHNDCDELLHSLKIAPYWWNVYLLCWFIQAIFIYWLVFQYSRVSK